MELFSVVQYFEDDTYEYVRKAVDAKEALAAFSHYTTSVGVQIGFVKRVIIIDSGDCVAYEWEYGKGITFPKEK